MKTNQKKTVLVTGASSGFGKGTAEKLLELGHIVYAAARSVDKMKDLEQKGARILKMDVTDNESVIAGINQIINEQNKIDILYNNAGYGTYGTVENIDMEEIKYQYEVNVFGAARVLKAVLPQMRKQKSGRIIITASVVSHISTMGTGWYASTKHAIKALAESLRQEVKHLGIEVVMIKPGGVKTGFDKIAFNTLDKVDMSDEYKDLLKNFKTFMQDTYSKCPGPESTVKAMIKAGLAKKPKTVYKTTSDVGLYITMQSLLSDRAFDSMMISSVNKGAKKIAHKNAN